jgi:hypothetical protein
MLVLNEAYIDYEDMGGLPSMTAWLQDHNVSSIIVPKALGIEHLHIHNPQKDSWWIIEPALNGDISVHYDSETPLKESPVYTPKSPSPPPPEPETKAVEEEGQLPLDQNDFDDSASIVNWSAPEPQEETFDNPNEETQEEYACIIM